jgi:hypothetical protein
MQRRKQGTAVVSGAGPRQASAYSCSPPDSPTLLQMLENLAWIFVAACMLFYGNGEKDAIDVVRTDPRILDTFITAACVCACLNVACFVYVHIYLAKIKGVKDPENSAQQFVALGAATMVAGGFSLMVGIWPVWGILSPIMVFVLFMGLLMSLQFVPTFGILRVKTS